VILFRLRFRLDLLCSNSQFQESFFFSLFHGKDAYDLLTLASIRVSCFLEVQSLKVINNLILDEFISLILHQCEYQIFLE